MISTGTSQSHSGFRGGSEVTAQYIEGAWNLRMSLEANKRDFDFASGGGRIVYLLDANIVRFFIDPESEARHLLAFHKAPTDYGAATALITAEFLFSRGLAGQKNSPALITPSHADEIEAIMVALEKVVLDQAHKAGEQLVTEKLRMLVENLEKGAIDRSKAVASLREDMPAVGAFLAGGWSWARQMLRLYRDDLLRPLVLHPAVNAVVLNPPDDEVATWREVISTERISRESHLPSQRRAPLREIHKRSEADAAAIAQLILLNAAADEKFARELEDDFDLEQPERTRYVLVTADMALFDAYTNWFWSDKNSHSEFFALRNIQQYVPILNAYEMPNGIDNSDLTLRARDALDGLFANIRAADSSFDSKISYYRLLARGEQQVSFLDGLFEGSPLLFGTQDANHLQAVKDIWDACFRDGVVLNARLMNRRPQETDLAAEWLTKLSDKLTTDVDLREVFIEEQRRNLEQIKRAHTVFGSRSNLATLLSESRPSQPRPNSRVHMFVRTQFPEILGEEPLFEALNRVAAGGGEIAARLSRYLESADYKSIYLAACIAFRCGSWLAAILYTNSAIEEARNSLDSDVDLADILLLRAAAVRQARALRLPELDAVQVRDTLDELLRVAHVLENQGDPLGSAEALCEFNSIVLTELFISDADTVAFVGCVPDATASVVGNAQVISALLATVRLHSSQLTERNSFLVDEIDLRLQGHTIRRSLLTFCREPGAASYGLSPTSEAVQNALQAISILSRRNEVPLRLQAEAAAAAYQARKTDELELDMMLSKLKEEAATRGAFYNPDCYIIHHIQSLHRSAKSEHCAHNSANIAE